MRKHSLKTIERMRVAARRRIATPEGKAQLQFATTKANIARTGSTHTEETKFKMSEAKKVLWADPKTRVCLEIGLKKGQHSRSPNGGLANAGKPKSEEHCQALRERRALQVFPLRDSKPELIVQKLLTHLGIIFEKHAIIPGLGLHQWDLLIPSSKTLVEIDGCYWHACPCTVKALNPNQIKRKARDAELTMMARNAGWKVIRIPEHDIVDANLGSIFESVG